MFCAGSVLVSMCPLSMESRAVAAAELPAHFGPAIPEVNSVWLKLYLYHLTGSGPPSFCLTKGETRPTGAWRYILPRSVCGDIFCHGECVEDSPDLT